MRKYFYSDGFKKWGPFSKEELTNQKINRKTKIWYYGLETWVEMNQIDDLSEVATKFPPELNPTINKEKTKNSNAKKKTQLLTYYHNNSDSINWISGVILIMILPLVLVWITQKETDEYSYNDIVTNSYNTDEKFDIYVQNFYRDLEYHGIFPIKPKKTIIKFCNLDQLEKSKHLHGISFGGSDDDKIEIYINSSSWKKFNKATKYFVMYHELAHDLLNLNDLENKSINQGKLMFPEISSFKNKKMDEFIESFHTLFKEYSKK